MISAEKGNIMTVQDFIKYYNVGHGRAAYALQSITDKEPYRKAFFECVKNENGDYRGSSYILNIAKQLVTKEHEQEFVDILFAKCNNGSYFPTDIILVLAEYVPRDHLVAYVETEYKKAFDNYIQLPPDQEDRNIASRYNSFVIAVNLLLGDNDSRLTSIMQDCGKLFEIRKGLWLEYNPLLYLRFNHHKDRAHFESLFADALKDSPIFDEIQKCTFSDVRRQSEPKEFKTAQDFIDGLSCSFEKALNSFRSADAKIVKEVAEIAISENKEQSVIAFNYFSQPVGNGSPAFPLESERLINIIEKYKHLFSNKKIEITVERAWVHNALYILNQIKGKAEKEYCLSIAKDESIEIFVRINALHTLVSNYEQGDGDLIRRLYRSETVGAIIALLFELADAGIKDAPYELCIDAYENSDNFERESAAQTMQLVGLMTDAIAEECIFDDNPVTREIGTAYKNRKNK